MNDTLFVCEIFRSIQGESSWAGLPCIFIRLAGCNLSCSYCDTDYAKASGTGMNIAEILAQVNNFKGTLVEITGGEPLAQAGTPLLINELTAQGKKVLIETNGSYSIDELPIDCIRIIDVKCPSSGECGSFNMNNIASLRHLDEVKFVIGSPEDFSWAQSFIQKQQLESRAGILFSPVAGTVVPADLAAWILESGLTVRMQVQLHKIIWGNKKGV